MSGSTTKPSSLSCVNSPCDRKDSFEHRQRMGVNGVDIIKRDQVTSVQGKTKQLFQSHLHWMVFSTLRFPVLEIHKYILRHKYFLSQKDSTYFHFITFSKKWRISSYMRHAQTPLEILPCFIQNYSLPSLNKLTIFEVRERSMKYIVRIKQNIYAHYFFFVKKKTPRGFLV